MALRAAAQTILDYAPDQDLASCRGTLVSMRDICQEGVDAIDFEQHQYECHMKMLLQDARRKMDRMLAENGDDTDDLIRQLGPDIMMSYKRLNDNFQDVDFQIRHEGYLTKLFQHWRKYEQQRERQKYEAVWEWIARRPFPSTD